MRFGHSCALFHSPQPALEQPHLEAALREEEGRRGAAPPALAIGDIFLGAVEHGEHVAHLGARGRNPLRALGKSPTARVGSSPAEWVWPVQGWARAALGERRRGGGCQARPGGGGAARRWALGAPGGGLPRPPRPPGPRWREC